MNIVQSFWSLPSLSDSGSGSAISRFAGGWRDPKYHLMSWALSCLQLKKFYSSVNLVTDRSGAELLIGHLGLPYDDVKVELNALDRYDPAFWSLGKIYSYSIQQKPFIHVDSDVYIWSRFSKKIETASLIAQNVEYNFSFYRKVMNMLMKNQCKLPDFVLRNFQITDAVDAYNTGVVGGSDVTFFKSLADVVFSFLEFNKQELLSSSAEDWMLNAFFEQHFYRSLAASRNLKVECLTKVTDKTKLNQRLKSIERFRAAPAGRINYIHLFGGDSKTNDTICMELEEKLRKSHPKYYCRIEEFCRQIKNALNPRQAQIQSSQ